MRADRRTLGKLWLSAAYCLCGACVQPVPSDSAVDASPGTDALAPATLCADPRADPWPLLRPKASSGAHFRVALLAATPSPPAVGKNTWTLRVTGPDEQPVTGIDLSARAFMPDHGHGTALPSVVSAMSPGTHQVRALDLFMEGVWQVDLLLAPGSDPEERLSITYCLQEASR